jgi:hypothetical protein
VVFFRYLNSAIKFYQMVGRGTRIHEETKKYKFWLYDYTGVSRASPALITLCQKGNRAWWIRDGFITGFGPT